MFPGAPACSLPCSAACPKLLPLEGGASPTPLLPLRLAWDPDSDLVLEASRRPQGRAELSASFSHPLPASSLPASKTHPTWPTWAWEPRCESVWAQLLQQQTELA